MWACCVPADAAALERRTLALGGFRSRYTSPVRILVNFMHRDGWSVHCLAKDGKTVISPFMEVASESTLLRLLKFCGATDAALEEAQRDIDRWGRGSIWLEVTPKGKRLLRVWV